MAPAARTPTCREGVHQYEEGVHHYEEGVHHYEEGVHHCEEGAVEELVCVAHRAVGHQSAHRQLLQAEEPARWRRTQAETQTQRGYEVRAWLLWPRRQRGGARREPGAATGQQRT